MRAISKRLDKIEASHATRQNVIVVCLVDESIESAHRPVNPNYYRCEGSELMRLHGEDDKAFYDRAVAEFKAMFSGVRNLVIRAML